MSQNTMRALVKREATKGIWMEQVPVPTPGPNEVLIKLEKTAICGTDLHIYLWDEWSQRTIKPGLVIGHEFVGRIVEIGPGVSGYTFQIARQRRRPHRLRPLPQLPRRQAAPVPEHRRHRREPQRRVCRIHRDATATCGRSRTRSRANWPRSSIPTATLRTARWNSTWSARTC